MAWETRSGKPYYYRKRRVDGKVVSEYVGTGGQAEEMAVQDELDRDLRKAQEDKVRSIIQGDKLIDRQIDCVSAQMMRIVHGFLLINGYHTHKRKWRKYRQPVSPNDRDKE